jgi:hypothetical protein
MDRGRDGGIILNMLPPPSEEEEAAVVQRQSGVEWIRRLLLLECWERESSRENIGRRKACRYAVGPLSP